MSEFIKNNKGVIAVFLSVVIIFGSFFTWVIMSIVQYNEWFNSLTPEERQEYEIQKKEKYESNVYRYEIVSVHKYVKQIFNKPPEICYSFTYLNGRTLVEVNDFQHLPYGLTKVTIGNKNQYIVDTNGEDIQYLQLTKETMANMSGLS